MKGLRDKYRRIDLKDLFCTRASIKRSKAGIIKVYMLRRHTDFFNKKGFADNRLIIIQFGIIAGYEYRLHLACKEKFCCLLQTIGIY